MTISDIQLWEKSGGRSGIWRRKAAEEEVTFDL
jgi:hypothetical protein